MLLFSSGIWDRLKGTKWVLGNTSSELIVAKVTKAKFSRTVTKKLVASRRTVRVRVLDGKDEGHSKFTALPKESKINYICKGYSQVYSAAS